MTLQSSCGKSSLPECRGWIRRTSKFMGFLAVTVPFSASYNEGMNLPSNAIQVPDDQITAHFGRKHVGRRFIRTVKYHTTKNSAAATSAFREVFASGSLEELKEFLKGKKCHAVNRSVFREEVQEALNNYRFERVSVVSTEAPEMLVSNFAYGHLAMLKLCEKKDRTLSDVQAVHLICARINNGEWKRGGKHEDKIVEIANKFSYVGSTDPNLYKAIRELKILLDDKRHVRIHEYGPEPFDPLSNGKAYGLAYNAMMGFQGEGQGHKRHFRVKVPKEALAK